MNVRNSCHKDVNVIGKDKVVVNKTRTLRDADVTSKLMNTAGSG